MRFESSVRYHSKGTKRIYFTHPKQFSLIIGINYTIDIPVLEPGQEAVICCVSRGSTSQGIALMEARAIPAAGPLPQPPAEYAEIQFAGFDFRDNKPGRKFWTRVVLEKQTDGKIVCKQNELYPVPVSFILPRPLPALVAEDLELIVMFTTAPVGEDPVLDAAILYDQWLLSPPAETPYEKIDFEDFLRIKEDGTITMKKYQFTARYERIDSERLKVVHPDLEKSTISALVAYNKPLPVDIQKYQKIVVRFTKFEGTTLSAVAGDDIEALPLPQPPAGYEEIDRFDLVLGFQNQRFEPGHKLCSRWNFTVISGTQVIFDTGGGQALAFDLTKRPPKMLMGQSVLVLYTFASYTSRPNCTLDDIVVV